MTVSVVAQRLAPPASIRAFSYAAPPATSAASAALGFNADSNFTAAKLPMILAAASHVRFQPAWSDVESYASPGTYSLGATEEAALAYCGSNAMKVVAVCAYGPPYSNVLTLTVAGSSPITAGAYTVPVVEAVSSITAPLDHVKRQDGTQVTAKWGYYGSLIDSTNSGSNSIVLASATAITLNPGDKLTVNRLLYASPADQLQTNTSLVAYFNYLKYVAGRISANGASGWCSIWNEPPWAHDPWDARGKFYDIVPQGMNADVKLKMFLTYALAINTLPSGVRIINGVTDKTASGGMVEQGLGPTSAQVAASVGLESIHPYHNLPEGSLWDQSSVSGGGYKLLNPTVDAGHNFQLLAYVQDQAHIGLGRIATECGVDEPNDYRQAVYLLRRVITSWACQHVPVIYSFGENDGTSYSVVNPTTYAPRQSYVSMQTLMNLVSALGGAGGSASKLPALIGYPSGSQWPIMICGIYGANGALMFVWQRTGADSSATWDTWPTPATYYAWFAIPAGATVQSVTDVLTGSSVPYAVSGGALTISAVGESPVAVRLT